jgi:hypothetical protein
MTWGIRALDSLLKGNGVAGSFIGLATRLKQPACSSSACFERTCTGTKGRAPGNGTAHKGQAQDYPVSLQKHVHSISSLGRTVSGTAIAT